MTNLPKIKVFKGFLWKKFFASFKGQKNKSSIWDGDFKPDLFQDENGWVCKDFKALTKHWVICLQNHPLAFVKVDICDILLQFIDFLRTFSSRLPEPIAKACVLFIARALSVRTFQRLPPNPKITNIICFYNFKLKKVH